MVELVFGVVEVSIKVTVPLNVGVAFVAYVADAFDFVKYVFVAFVIVK